MMTYLHPCASSSSNSNSQSESQLTETQMNVDNSETAEIDTYIGEIDSEGVI